MSVSADNSVPPENSESSAAQRIASAKAITNSVANIAGDSKRFLALDVLRGLTIAFMIIVNTPGSWQHVYAPLLHADWHGFTPTDLVFPTFLFVVGNAMSFTLPKYMQLGQSLFLQKIFRRSLLIILCGVLLYWLPFFKPDAQGQWHFIAFADTRLPGVLQRIGLCFALAALIIYYGKQKFAWLYCLIALLAYWAILAFGGDLSMAGNAARKFDLWLLGAAHLYHGEGMPFDPEGVLGTLPATVNVLAGYFAGNYLQRARQSNAATAEVAKLGGNMLNAFLMRMLVVASGLILLAICWQMVLPINKKLWTSSYVVLTVGLDVLLLAALVYLIDVRQWRYGSNALCLLGKNALAIYLFSELIVIALINLQLGAENAYDALYKRAFLPWAGELNGSLAFALTTLGLCWLLAWLLDKRKIIIRL